MLSFNAFLNHLSKRVPKQRSHVTGDARSQTADYIRRSSQPSFHYQPLSLVVNLPSLGFLPTALCIIVSTSLHQPRRSVLRHLPIIQVNTSGCVRLHVDPGPKSHRLFLDLPAFALSRPLRHSACPYPRLLPLAINLLTVRRDCCSFICHWIPLWKQSVGCN
jgi:hypothetical protein